MNARRQKRLYTGLILVLGLSITIGLVLYALKENIDLFYTPNEIVNGKKETGIKPQIDQRLRIGGMVVEGSVKRGTDNLNVQFELADAQSKQNIVVVYDGILPDLFREGQGIVANGYLRTPTKIEAFEVLAKHDEEYMPPDLAEAMKGIKHVKPQQNPALSEQTSKPISGITE
ncbi:cytochrome c maturation protein CcmE [Catenovulum adriaticum]|uniref:Cytochrome c-type biogenesis protein CcmE n=1 Tax=Catenovulum adriaticum TaxID=2984846 RepID=A0ABY7AJ33_9ALTE|nr:cytochrome c maturation protein CcmE [Catenovulum sp. TS8]WAJ69257.1 cytochrome c maturation protein CcmE [Catenovulum sp. TS8]